MRGAAWRGVAPVAALRGLGLARVGCGGREKGRVWAGGICSDRGLSGGFWGVRCPKVRSGDGVEA